MKNENTFDLTLPKSRNSKEVFNIKIKEVDEAAFMAASMLVKAGKEIEATKQLLKDLHAGGDNIEEVLNCFPAVHSAMGAVLELLTPLEYTLKKS